MTEAAYRQHDTDDSGSGALPPRPHRRRTYEKPEHPPLGGGRMHKPVRGRGHDQWGEVAQRHHVTACYPVSMKP
jgi:hypothetical protein